MVFTTSKAARAGLADLIDYAGLFPPAALPMDAARAEYDALRGRAQGWMLGRFVVPLSRIEQLQAEISGVGFAASAILDAGTEPLAWFGDAVVLLERSLPVVDAARVRIETLEVPLPPLKSAREDYGSTIGQVSALLARFGLGGLPAYVEWPRDARWMGSLETGMESLGRHGLRAKVRCGGVVPQAFPSCAELAAFVVAAARAKVAFRATAGLHHPVRHFDAALGCAMHGFLNVLAATLVALGGGDRAEVQAILEEEHPGAFRFTDDAMQAGVMHFDLADIVATRERGFVAYGSCSFDEPIADLTAMGILDSAVAS